MQWLYYADEEYEYQTRYYYCSNTVHKIIVYINIIIAGIVVTGSRVDTACDEACRPEG
jgi:hypothetical protein